LATERAEAGTNRAQGSFTLVRKLVAGRTIFLGPKTEQSLVQFILVRLPHPPAPLAGRDFA